MKQKLFRVLLLSLAAFTTGAIGVAGQTPASSPTDIQKDRHDIRKDTKDIRSDRRDIRKDVKDRRTDVRDLREDRREGASKQELKSDRRDIRADTRDIRHDRRDLKVGCLDRSVGPPQHGEDEEALRADLHLDVRRVDVQTQGALAEFAGDGPARAWVEPGEAVDLVPRLAGQDERDQRFNVECMIRSLPLPVLTPGTASCATSER